MRLLASAHSDGTSITRVCFVKTIDLLDRRKNRNVWKALQRGEIVRIGSPHGHGGELNVRHPLGQCEEDGDSFNGARIHHRDVGVVEAGEIRKFAGFEQRDGHVNRVDLCEFANVARYVFTDSDYTVRAAEGFCPGKAGHGTVWTERSGYSRTDQMDHAGARGSQG